MRIGLVVPGFSANAADWCIPALRHFVRQLASRDHVRVIAVRYPYAAARYTIDGAQVTAVGGATKRGPATLGLWRQTLEALRAEHRQQPFDILHAFWATESGLLATFAGRLLRVPTLVSVAGGELVAIPDIAYGDQRLAWERLKVTTSVRLATAVSAGSHQLVRRLERRRNAHHLPLGVDIELFQPSAAPRGVKLLHVGGLTPVKDQQLLLRAFASLRKRVSKTALDIVGDGPLKPELRRLAVELDVADAVCFRNEIDHAYLPAVYTGADVFVLSSRHEAQGMVVLEAAACGRTVVGTQVGVIPELEPIGALSVPPRDHVSLADALERALDCRSDGRQLVEATFSLDHCGDRFRDVYGTLAAG